MEKQEKQYAKLDAEEMQYARQLGARVLYLRQAKKLSQRGLSELAGVDMATISLLETGKRLPNLRTLIKLSGFLGAELDIQID